MKKIKFLLMLWFVFITVTAIAATWQFKVSFFNGGEKPDKQDYKIVTDNNLWHLMCEQRFDNVTYSYPCETGYFYEDINEQTIFMVGNDKIVCETIKDDVMNCYVKNFNIGITAVRDIPPDEADNETDNETE